MSGSDIFFLSVVLGAFGIFAVVLAGSTIHYNAWVRSENKARR
ncbi:MAG TPA: hypothetical protein VMI56_27580 [Reyranella sp.]|nr:hypothetical protein [Reyranella sp.]